MLSYSDTHFLAHESTKSEKKHMEKYPFYRDVHSLDRGKPLRPIITETSCRVYYREDHRGFVHLRKSFVLFTHMASKSCP